MKKMQKQQYNDIQWRTQMEKQSCENKKEYVDK